MPDIPTAEQKAHSSASFSSLSASHALPASGAEVRSVPLSPSSASSAPPRRGKAAGRLLSVQPGGVGLALLRLEQVRRVGKSAEDNGLSMSVDVEGKSVGVRPWLPHWWPAEVREGEKE
jgi:hypothetical protein